MEERISYWSILNQLRMDKQEIEDAIFALMAVLGYSEERKIKELESLGIKREGLPVSSRS